MGMEPPPIVPPRMPKSEAAPWEVKSRPTTIRKRPSAYGRAWFRCVCMGGSFGLVGT